MKKFLLSLITIMYMTVSSGIAMNIHYCMGEKAGIDFYEAADEKCGKCGMTEKKGGCCHDEHKFYKLDDAHKNVLSAQVDIPFFIVPATPSFYQLIAASTVDVESFAFYDPPLGSSLPLFIQYRVFRI